MDFLRRIVNLIILFDGRVPSFGEKIDLPVQLLLSTMASSSNTTKLTVMNIMQNQFFGSIFNRSSGAALLASLMTTAIPTATAQDACCFQPAYRLECETVMQPETVERMRVTYETKMVEEEVTSFRPVLKTRTEERSYKVARPVTETSYREERYTIYRPVTETSYRDETVTQTRYVDETAEREEKVTTYRPVTETQMYQQQYTVQRPVTETQMYQRQYTVQRPVVETQYQNETVTSYRPVTTVQQQTIDAGGYVPQTTVTPGSVQNVMGWNPRAYAVPGPLGIFARVQGAPVVTQAVTPPVAQTQMVYRPNYITQDIAQTSYVPESHQVQRPIQVTRMQSEVVTQNVPVQVQRMQSEVVTQNIPVQKTRMVPETTVRKVPYTIRRPITETTTRKVPVQHQRWVAEQRVRKVPVQSTRMVYETRSEPVTVKYYEQEEVRRTVLRPVTVPKYEPYTVERMVPRQVVQRLPLSYVDPFSSAISSGYSSFSPVMESAIECAPIESSSDSVRSNRVSPDDGESVLEGPTLNDDDQPLSRMGRVEMDLPQSESSSGQGSSTNGAGEQLQEMFDGNDEPQTLPDPRDGNPVETPELDARQTRWQGQSASASTIRPIAHRVQWNPIFAQEI
ncbi:hypothetical protein Poly21_14760 [Allorhodopirellula heiligendammensis]|uniref:Uncharacterized protein n=2 Tax=Allorhodopirellula heiligendammensis TaxID=2714739 RepID=A0A5C6C7K9_9BACT|nr:hypothetical protein Poly21_14760 [Allorhodopirellula heiligendammensis]